MRRTVFLSLIALAMIVAIGLQIRSGYAIPPSITISGVLKGADGKPLTGSYPAEVKFYRTQTDTEVVDTRPATVQVVEGVFSISLIPDVSLLDADELWYSLAIDSDGDGIGAADLFPNRFQVTSVPYALTAKPATFFNSHAGLGAGIAQSFGSRDSGQYLYVSPFVTPPGGVQFNRMSAYLAGAAGLTTPTFSFGVYERTGDLLYSSGPLTSVASGFPLRQISIPNGYLAPSTKYYTGWTTDEINGQGRGILETNIAAVTDTGYILLPDFDGMVPETFYTGGVIYYDRGALNITFELLGDESVYGTSGIRANPEVLKRIDSRNREPL